jgi:DNA-binding response OmpR family regulator
MTGPTRKTLEGARVLVVEDEFFIADDIARGLRQEGAEPLGPASTVRQAEQIIAGEHVDAAILDLNLRGDSAADFVSRLASSRVPCLIVSGYGEDAVPKHVSHLPRIEKPVSVARVLDRLSEELAPARHA